MLDSLYAFVPECFSAWQLVCLRAFVPVYVATLR